MNPAQLRAAEPELTAEEIPETTPELRKAPATDKLLSSARISAEAKAFIEGLRPFAKHD
jgi:hypothetical protein